eukprot:1160920-Pelagomonas_calceolata.AAC.2
MRNTQLLTVTRPHSTSCGSASSTAKSILQNKQRAKDASIDVMHSVFEVCKGMYKAQQHSTGRAVGVAGIGHC